MNVAKTYVEMSKKVGITQRQAIADICSTVGLKLSNSYITDWPDDSKTRPIPPTAVKEMQIRCALYAAQSVGIKTTKEKAEAFAELLSPKVQLKDK